MHDVAPALQGPRALALATWGLFAGLVLVLLAGGMFSTLLGIRAELEGLPTFVSGGLTAAYYAGFLVGTRVALRALRLVGHIRVYAALTAVLSAAVLLIGLLGAPVAWIVLRLITGLCFAGLYVVAESWLNGLAHNSFRGRLLAVYSLVVVGSFGAGQLLVFDLDARSLVGFAIAAVIASLGVVPVMLSEQASVPSTESVASMSLGQLARIVPTGAGTMLLVGLAHGGLSGMAVIYATRSGLGVGRVGLLLAAVQIGGMLFNWPISAASDDIDRRVVGAVVSIGAMGIAATLFLGAPQDWWVTLMFLLLGGLTSPLYAIAGAYTNDWIEPALLGAAASQLVTLYGVGAMIGPLVASGFMEVFGTDGWVWSIIVLHGLIAAFLFYRIRAWTAPLTARPWREVSVPARAFFIPATIVAMGTRPRRSRR